MTIRSEWTLSLPFEGGWISLSANVPDMEVISDEDAKFVDGLREEMLDRIGQVILQRKAMAGQPDKNEGDRAGLVGREPGNNVQWSSRPGGLESPSSPSS